MPKITLEDLKKGTSEQRRVFENSVRMDTEVDSAINEADNTIWFIAVSDDNAGMRETWSGVRYIEQIDVDSINTDRFKVFAKDHNPSTDNVIGRVVQVVKENGKLKAQIKFSFTDSAREVFQKYKEGILTDVSIGYRYDLEKATIIDDEVPVVILREVEIFELSSVWMGFDGGAKIGRKITTKENNEENHENGGTDDVQTALEASRNNGLSAQVVADRIKILTRRK